MKAYDPWGVWNKHLAAYDEEDIRIRTVDKRKYYEIALSGVFIIKSGKERIMNIENNFPIIAIQGEHTKIEKYESSEDGFIFYLIGDGFKHNLGHTEFQDNTQLQVKMHFINNDECYFEYVSREDENGFHLSYFPEEGVIYKRLSADRGSIRPEISKK